MKNLTKFFSLIKSDKKTRMLSIITIALLFMFTIGYSLSVFTNSSNKKIANIKVNDLSFSMTTNSGEEDDRILHLQAGKTESFNIVITNLNKIDLKYELNYEVCNDVNCNETSNSLPDNVNVLLDGKSKDDTVGTILSFDNNKKISIGLISINNSNQDYYLRLSLNAGYTWNNLVLVNQFETLNKTSLQSEIIAYVDGQQVSTYPDSCDYFAELKGYNGNNEVSLTDKSVTCDTNTRLWKTSYVGYASKIVINFTYNLKAPKFSYTGKYMVVNGESSDWNIKLLSSGTFIFLNDTSAIDVFVVGGGGGGCLADSYGYDIHGDGGGGGYTKTQKNILVEKGNSYTITIGSGGAGVNGSPWVGGTGGTTSAFGVSASGGKGGSGNVAGWGVGGSGGSGGGICGGSGGSNGGNGINGDSNPLNPGTIGKGQSSNTRAFGENNGELFAGGGGGAWKYTAGAGGAGGGGNAGVAGTANTGGGGGAGGINLPAQAGGSGIAIIRATKNT